MTLFSIECSRCASECEVRAEAPTASGPLTLDDLLELHETLADDSGFDRLACTCPTR